MSTTGAACTLCLHSFCFVFLLQYIYIYKRERGTLKEGLDEACEVSVFSLIKTSISFLQLENGMAVIASPKSHPDNLFHVTYVL